MECGRAFCKLKEVLLPYPVLHSVDSTKPLILQVDEPEVGVGAVISNSLMRGIRWPTSVESYSPENKSFQQLRGNTWSLN